MKHFKKQTVSDLYVWIVRYWDDLKSKFGDENVSMDKAVTDFYNMNKIPLLRKLKNKTIGFILRKKIQQN